MAPKPNLSHPDRKISKTLLLYAAPLLQELPVDAREQRAEQALHLTWTVWDAGVLADVIGNSRFLEDARRSVAHAPELSPLVEDLIDRKRALFGVDERLLGGWKVTRTMYGINLHAEARDPRTPPPLAE